MKKRTIKLLKGIAIVCVTILIIELIYIFYLLQGKSIYFDGINSVINVDNGYVSVGSNNNNDKYYEKAKITKYDSDKVQEFEKIYNKGYNGVFFDVIEDQEKNLIAVGSFEANDKDHSEGNRVGLIVKYDKDGNILYENSFKVLDNSKFTSIALTNDGYVVTGQSVYDNMKVGLSLDGGAIVIKYDKDLKMTWMKNYGDSKTGCYNDVIIYDNYIYTVGVTDSIVGIISKYDMNGELVKSVRYDNTDNLGFTGIDYFNGRILVSGAKKNDTDINALLIKYNFDLELRKEVVYEGENLERFNQFVVDKHNNVILVGTSAKVDDESSGDKVNV